MTRCFSAAERTSGHDSPPPRARETTGHCYLNLSRHVFGPVRHPAMQWGSGWLCTPLSVWPCDCRSALHSTIMSMGIADRGWHFPVAARAGDVKLIETEIAPNLVFAYNYAQMNDLAGLLGVYRASHDEGVPPMSAAPRLTKKTHSQSFSKYNTVQSTSRRAVGSADRGAARACALSPRPRHHRIRPLFLT